MLETCIDDVSLYFKEVMDDTWRSIVSVKNVGILLIASVSRPGSLSHFNILVFIGILSHRLSHLIME